MARIIQGHAGFQDPRGTTHETQGARQSTVSFIRTKRAGKHVARAGRVGGLFEACPPRRLVAHTAQHGPSLPHALQQVLEQLLVHDAPPSSLGYGLSVTTGVPDWPEAQRQHHSVAKA